MEPPAVRSYDRLWVLFPYIGKYRKLLASYKFKKNLALANFFSEKIYDLIQKYPELKEAVIIPVPPRPGKIKETGWDQVEHLVKKLEEKFDLIVNRYLKRLKSKVQKSLNRTDRLKNLKGKIYLNANSSEETCANTIKIALLIDDVITTGSTMEVCASVLKEAGVQKVYGISLFYD